MATYIEVMRKIIYAVETGGQIYGNARYDDFTEAYTNSSIEYAITIGAGQWYATEAKTLLNKIRTTYPTKFKQLDTAGIASDLDNKNWSSYNISKTSAKAKCIVSIINSTEGRKIQDSLVDKQMETYMEEAKKLGVTSIQGQMMCANFRHQGGSGAVTRILAKTAKPYTLDNLYKACCTDTGNQVGAYRTRQQKVYAWIKEKVVDSSTSNITNGGGTMTKQEAINKMIAIATNEIGYLEKASNSNLDSKTGNAGQNNYTKYWRDIYPSYQGQPWCACFVTWVLQTAFGKDIATKMLKHYPYVYVPTMMNLFTRNANPEVGDIVCFYHSGTFTHTGIVIAVNGDLFTTIEGNTSGGSTIIANGGGVCKKSYYNSNMIGTKFARLDWSYAMNSGASSTTTTTPTPTTSTSSGNALIKAGQIHANNFCGIKIATDGVYGSETKKAGIKVLQTALNLDYNAKLEVDGILGAKTKKALGNHYVAYGEKQMMCTCAEILMLLNKVNPNGVECAGIYGDGLKNASKTKFGGTGKKITASQFLKLL